MKRPLVAVILAGGTGTRMYPASRSDRPKQFHDFGTHNSLLAETVDRVTFADHVIVSTQPGFADDVPDHAPDAEILVEPAPKDTGPAVLYAVHTIAEEYADPVVLCVPSDHWIQGEFKPVAQQAARVAVETQGLVTIGISPTRPATGYGYIKPGRVQDGYAPVRAFNEKPAQDTAADLVSNGWLWNAGMFAFTPDALIEDARDSPLAPLVRALDGDEPTRGFDAVDAISLDFAVVEDTDRGFVVPANFEWDDLGTWDAIGRVVDSPLCDALTLDTTETIIAGDDSVHVTAIGVSDLVIAAYDDRVLVVPADEAERVRDAVRRLREDDYY